MKARWAGFLVFFALLVSLNVALAADSGYPTKEIGIIGAFGPGAGTDLGARMIVENSKKYLGQEVIVTNQPGGGGRVAVTLVGKAKPDGYTLGSVDSNIIVLKPHMEKVLYKFDDFTYITQFGVLNLGIIVPTASPFRNFKDFLDFAQANPDKLTVSNVGMGSTGHLCTAALNLMGGVKMKPIPFDGAATAVTALLGGHVMASAVGFSGFAQHLRAKSVRLLALMGDERMDAYPDVPTLKELGYALTLQAWYLMIGPKNMDKAVVKKLEEAFRKGIDSPGFIKLAKEIEIYAKNPLSGDPLREELTRRNNSFSELVKKLGLEAK
jgi:tripartite-type tricarboxylate transporter receptor subunit TctC